MSNPPLTVVTVTWNCVDVLPVTIASLQKQTRRDFEWLVIDGGSNDGTLELLEQHRELVDVLVCEPDRGIYDAMNKGIALAKGRYINFMNAGDAFFEATTLEKVIPQFSGQDILFGDVELVYEHKQIIRRYPKRLSATFFTLNTLCHQVLFYRKQWFDVTGDYVLTEPIFADYKHLLQSYFHPTFVAAHLGTIVASYDMQGVSAGVPLSYLRRSEWYFRFGGLRQWLRLTWWWGVMRYPVRLLQKFFPGWTFR